MVGSLDDPQRAAYAPNAVLKAFKDAGVQSPHIAAPTNEQLRDILIDCGLMEEA